MGDILFASQVRLLTERETEVLRLIADGLSNREIAESLVVTVDTVKWYNRQIFEKLGVKSRTQVAALAREAGLIDSETGVKGSHRLPKNNLPVVLTSFVGRGHEIGEVVRLVRENRLVTLTGPAGTGKTRLAVEAASRMLPTFPDGVYFVDLARITQASQVAKSIADSIGLPEAAVTTITDTLKSYLSHQAPLVILDNFEHLIEATPQIGEWLTAAPGLRLLITSREGLRIYGEREFLVLPLELPDVQQQNTLITLVQCESIALFLDRARSVNAGFVVTEGNSGAVAEICRHLDGLPLAIELAASRARLFSPEALLRRLESRFATLQASQVGLPNRHQTLRNAIAWSYDLLSTEEQSLLARLSVFQGGRSLEAVDAVAGYDIAQDTLEILESLVNKNLLVVTEGPEKEPRFVMLETIHEYAREKLHEMGDTENLKRRHAEYFAYLAQHAQLFTRGGPEQIRWLDRLEVEQQNIHKALEWSLDGGDVTAGLRLVGNLIDFWFRKGHYADGVLWTDRALDPRILDSATEDLRARVLYSAGMAAFYSHDYRQAKRLLAEAVDLHRALGNLRDAGYAQAWLASGYYEPDDSREEAILIAEESLSLLQSVNDTAGIAQVYNVIGELARDAGDFARAEIAYKECLRYAQAIDDRLRIALGVGNMGYIAQHQGQPGEALRLFQEAVRIGIAINITVHMVWGITAIAGGLANLGFLKRAARLMGAADGIIDSRRVSLMAGDRIPYESNRTMVRSMLDEETYQIAWEQGRAMSINEMLAYALETPAVGSE